MNWKKRILAMVLVLGMVLNWLPSIAFAQDVRDAFASESDSFFGRLGLTADSGIDPESGFATNLETLTKFEQSGLLPFSESDKVTVYEPTDLVTFIVVLENEPLLKHFSTDEIGRQTETVVAYTQCLEQQISTHPPATAATCTWL